MSKFIVIGGNPRSGTNLMRRIVGSHSQIAIPPAEFQFFNQLARGKTVEEILSNSRLEKWGVDLASYNNDDPAAAYTGILESYTKNLGKIIPGEKTPSNEFYYTDIKESLKDYDLKFIHMVRNPFDVMASYKHMRAMKGSSELNKIGGQIRNWVHSVSLAIERADADPDHYMFVRYEDLAGEPAPTTKLLCEYIGVEFEQDRMLGLADFAEHRDNTSFATAPGPAHDRHESIKAPVSRKSYLSKREIRQIANWCGAKAIEAGYCDPDFTAYRKGRGFRRWFR